MSVATEQDQVVGELRSADKLLLTTHENPDGDALGSLLAMHGILTQLGKNSLMYMSPDEFPLPWEYRGFQFDGLVGAPPEDVAERTIVFLDCGNIDRMPVDFLQADGLHILNIDHHHDNTRFGTVNLVCSAASCTAEIVWRISKELGAEITPDIAKALYVGLVTDTGRFMYENTSAAAHRHGRRADRGGGAAARRLPRAVRGPSLPAPSAAPARARERRAPRRRRDHDRPPHRRATTRRPARSRPTPRESSTTCGRSRERAWRCWCASSCRTTAAGCARCSLRATDGSVDVSRIARAFGGGGHPQAAGFSTSVPYPELVDQLRGHVRDQLPAS